MSVYVDNPCLPFGRMKMCHMMADSSLELLEMAEKIGIAEKWIQHAGSPREHFDVCMAKRKLAVAAGAVEVDGKALAKLIRKRVAP